MNQTQIKYARERAASIRTKREAALREKHTVTPQFLSLEEKLKALKSGSFKIDKSPKGKGYNPSWHQFVSFPAEITGGLNTTAFNKDKALLDAEFQKLNDELVLGDNEAALAMLRAFEQAA